MTIRPAVIVAAVLALTSAGCGEQAGDTPRATPVETTGKVEAELPEAVRVAALTARPDLDIIETEYEERDGRSYYDVGGILPDGSELELDMMLDDGEWIVVEVQRDIVMEALPAAVAGTLGSEELQGWAPDRIIESDQGDGVVIYEFFGDGADGERVKHEIRFEGGRAELLTEEWAH